MRGTALIIILSLGLLACAPAGAPLPTDPVTSPSPAAASPEPTPTDAPTGIDTEEPCTRSIGSGTIPEAIGYRAEDLKAMSLTAADLPAAELEPWVDQWYLGNSELQSIRLRTPTLCEDTERFGRINGYTASYETAEGDYQQRHTLSSWVHLFWDEDGARDWSAAFVDGLRGAVGTPGGPTRFDIEPIEDLPEGSSLITYEGPAGARTWAIVVDGPVVGWVVDEHDTLIPSDIDLTALARTMASRIETVSSEASVRPRDGLDIAGLQSVPLRLADYGQRYGDLEWDAYSSGLTDSFSPSCDTVAAEGGDLQRVEPVSGAAAIYAPLAGTQMREIVRVSSAVYVMEDADAASEALTVLAADRMAAGGERFDPGTFGDARIGVVTPPHTASGACEVLYTETLVMTRIGDVLATVTIQDRIADDQAAHVAALGGTLADRVTALQAQAGGACPHCQP